MKWFFSGLGTSLVIILIGWVLNEKLEILPYSKDNLITNNYKMSASQGDLNTLNRTCDTLYHNCSKLQDNYDKLERGYSESQNNYTDLKRDYNVLERNFDELQSKYNTLENNLNTIQNHGGIIIKSLRVGNMLHREWLANPGDTLQSSKMNFLTPQIIFDSYIDGHIILNIIITNPDGTLRVGENSPRGFSYTNIIEISRGNNQTCDLDGWGNPNYSRYESGRYTVEVWCKNKRLISEKVTIY